jgi:hypothetical protein
MSWFQWSFIIVGQKRWLETHIWHAKRMHMKNIWGYRLVSMQCFISASRPNLNIHVSLVGRLPEREISASYLQSFFSSLDPAWRVLYELYWIERFSWRDYKYACPYHRYVCGVCGKSKVIWQFFFFCFGKWRAYKLRTVIGILKGIALAIALCITIWHTHRKKSAQSHSSGGSRMVPIFLANYGYGSIQQRLRKLGVA